MDPSSVPSKLVCTVRDKGEGPLLQHLGTAGTVSGPAVHQAGSSTWGLQALSLDLPPSARVADLVKSQSDIYYGFPGKGWQRLPMKVPSLLHQEDSRMFKFFYCVRQQLATSVGEGRYVLPLATSLVSFAFFKNYMLIYHLVCAGDLGVCPVCICGQRTTCWSLLSPSSM